MERPKIEKQIPVRVRGTVTFINREWKLLCIQEGENAVKVFMETDADLERGQQVEVTGRPVFGDYATTLVLISARVIGDGEPVEPVVLDESRDFSLDLLYRWSEFEGPIYSAVTDDERVFLYVAGQKFGVFVALPKSSDLPPLATLRTSRIRVRGILDFSYEEASPWKIDLHSPPEEVIAVTPEVSKPDQPKLRKTSEILKNDRRGPVELPVRIRAVVRAISKGKRIFVSDDSGSLMIEVADDSQTRDLLPGDVVEAEGQVDRNRLAPFLANATVRHVGKGYSPPPKSVAAVDARKHLAQLIEVEGMVVAGNPGKNWLLLRDGGTFFRVRYPPQHATELTSLGMGSQLRLSGGCWSSPTDDASFEVLAQSADVVLKVPSSLPYSSTSAHESESVSSPGGNVPPARDQGPPAPPWLLIFLFLLLFLCGVIWLLLRRLKAQEKFQGSIHEQLSNLSHIARLNTLSEMVGALAHELNQPLASVSNYAAAAELLTKKETIEQERLAGVVSSIGQEAFRAGEIIRRLRTLVRRKTPGSHPVEVSEVVHEAIELFKTQQVTASGLVETDLPQNLPPVMADSIQIQQVVLNLLLNARDAIEDLTDRPASISIKASSENGMVYISVQDNGAGIASPDPSTVFEPYFTTRESGTGLGLAISRAIIESHGGTIRADNCELHGASITFSLPVAPIRISRPQSAAAG